MRNHAKDANLSRRIRGRGNRSMSASAAPASTATAGNLSGWNDRPGGRDLSGSAAAASAATAGTAFGRTRVIFTAGASAPATPPSRASQLNRRLIDA